ncbi:MAG: hypothetical protein U1E53_11255 [Dongiaceae bacterium]
MQPRSILVAAVAIGRRAGLLWLVLLLLSGSLAAARAADPFVPGTVLQSPVTLAGKQLVLPQGDWVVAGHGFETVAGLENVPYGAIESLVLFRLAPAPSKQVAAFVVARRNAVAIEQGWGIAPECQRTDLLLAAQYDDSDGHVFCGFVTHVLSAAGDQDDLAWQGAVHYAQQQGLSLPTSWLMAGFRLTDFSNLLDVRYHFNPELQGVAPDAAANWSDSAWSRAAIYGALTATGTPSTFSSLLNRVAFWRSAPPSREPASSAAAAERADLVNDLRDWLGRMRYPVLFGFGNRAAMLGAIPMPWPANAADKAPELGLRLAVLAQLHERGILDTEEYRRQAAIAEGLSSQHAGSRWTAGELTAVKALTDQATGAIGYFASDLFYTGTIITASQLWGFDQTLDAIRYTAQEYLWQRFGPRRLHVDEVVGLPRVGIDG